MSKGIQIYMSANVDFESARPRITLPALLASKWFVARMNQLVGL